jgi:hypothetical protein
MSFKETIPRKNDYDLSVWLVRERSFVLISTRLASVFE